MRTKRGHRHSTAHRTHSSTLLSYTILIRSRCPTSLLTRRSSARGTPYTTCRGEHSLWAPPHPPSLPARPPPPSPSPPAAPSRPGLTSPRPGGRWWQDEERGEAAAPSSNSRRRRAAGSALPAAPQRPPAAMLAAPPPRRHGGGAGRQSESAERPGGRGGGGRRAVIGRRRPPQGCGGGVGTGGLCSGLPRKLLKISVLSFLLSIAPLYIYTINIFQSNAALLPEARPPM